jgi:DNA-binding transcriptional regulator YiaG
MSKKLFAELVESMTQMNEIALGERAPSREFHIEPLAIKELRSKLGLSQPKFAALLHVDSNRRISHSMISLSRGCGRAQRTFDPADL